MYFSQQRHVRSGMEDCSYDFATLHKIVNFSVLCFFIYSVLWIWSTRPARLNLCKSKNLTKFHTCSIVPLSNNPTVPNHNFLSRFLTLFKIKKLFNCWVCSLCSITLHIIFTCSLFLHQICPQQQQHQELFPVLQTD